METDSDSDSLMQPRVTRQAEEGELPDLNLYLTATHKLWTRPCLTNKPKGRPSNGSDLMIMRGSDLIWVGPISPISTLLCQVRTTPLQYLSSNQWQKSEITKLLYMYVFISTISFSMKRRRLKQKLVYSPPPNFQLFNNSIFYFHHIFF